MLEVQLRLDASLAFDGGLQIGVRFGHAVGGVDPGFEARLRERE